MKFLTLIALLCLSPTAHAQSNVLRFGPTNRSGFTYTTNGILCLGGSWPTNVIISNDFTGTIQVGTNFMTGKELHDFVFRLEAFKTWAATNKTTLQPRPNINRSLSR